MFFWALIIASASVLPPVSPTPVPTRAPWRSRSLMIESEHTRSVSRDVLAHAGVPHHAVHACHARRVAWLLRRRSQLCRWHHSPRLFSRGPAALLSRASCTSCLAAPPLATCAHAHACGLQHRLGPSGGEAQGSHSLSVRSRRVHRSLGVDEEGHGDGLRRCGGRGNV